MRFDPALTNPCHSDYAEYSNFAKKLAEEMVLNYHAQGGTEYRCLQEWMIEDYKRLLEKMSKEYDAIWHKSWKMMGKNYDK